MKAATDGVKNLRVLDGGGIAFALQPQFVVIDGPRPVSGEYQFKIDRLGHERAGGHDKQTLGEGEGEGKKQRSRAHQDLQKLH